MKIRLAADLQTDSIVDGVGIRTVIWTQGCSHNCPGCHNPGTHDFNGGDLVELEDVIEELENLSGQDGVTFSGGDPMMQVEAYTELASFVKQKGMNVWCYTGFTFEELIKFSEKNDNYLKALKQTDVLVDGKFIIDLKSFDVQFRGSSNQRIIDVPKSLESGSVVVITKYK